MANFEFNSGHLLGRIGSLEYQVSQLKALNETFIMHTRHTFEDDDDESAMFISLTQLVTVVLVNIEGTIRELRAIADAGKQQEREADKEGKK